MLAPEVPASTPAGRTAESPATAQFERQADGRVVIRLTGTWRLPEALRAGEGVLRDLAQVPDKRQVHMSAEDVTGWDSAFVAFLTRLRAACAGWSIPLQWAGLPGGAERLVALATAVRDATDPGHGAASPPMLARIGTAFLARTASWRESVHFLGQVVVALGALARGRANFRREDLWRTVLETGAQALPIVGTINLLIGLIMAFIGAVQLSQFGASIYVADLVGLAMTREMAAVMTAIVLAGRTGAAFAAQLGTMQGNEEIDALATLGIPPVEFLVLPRLLALALMMPLLYVYACFIGLFGGYLVGIGMLDLSSVAFVDRLREAVGMGDFMIGFVKSVVFGMLVAFAGCQRGMQAGRSAAAVGLATTSAVVSAIIYIIVIDALFSVILNILKI
jgi:phospholipid/cholesterol/gamma-HCH transport system permease protein